MRTALEVGYVIVFMTASAGSGVYLKLAAESVGRTALWYFVLGNVIGFLCPVTLTLALKGSHPNVIYALCFGGAFATLQIVAWHIFKQPLSLYQWAGIAAVAIGILLLQIQPG